MAIQYQDFLLEEFRARRSRNSHYSLRAYARDLGMPASKLSQNLRGLCGISVAKAEKIAERLQMAGDEKQLFLALVESQHARSRVARQQASIELLKIRSERLDEVSLEKFSAIRDWYHLAILELTSIKGFQSDLNWIAAKLGLPINTVREGVERLRNLGLLEVGSEPWRATNVDFEVPGGVPSRTVREHHKQILTKAIAKVDDAAVEKREYMSTTLALDANRLGELRALMQELNRKVVCLSHQGEKNAVYCFSMQAFPLLEEEK